MEVVLILFRSVLAGSFFEVNKITRDNEVVALFHVKQQK